MEQRWAHVVYEDGTVDRVALEEVDGRWRMNAPQAGTILSLEILDENGKRRVISQQFLYISQD